MEKECRIYSHSGWRFHSLALIVLLKGVKWTAEARNVVCVAHDEDLPVEAELGSTDAGDWKTGFVAKSDVFVRALAVRNEGAVIWEHWVCGAGVCACFVFVLDEVEN